MRAALGRKTDEELLHAYFLDELSATGRRVIGELVETRMGSLDAFVARFAAAQGEVVARVRVKQCHVASAVDDRPRPLMRGVLVLTTKGVGFLPRGREDDAGTGALLGRATGSAGIGSLAGQVAGALWSHMTNTSRPVPNLSRVDLAVPLLAHIEPAAVWLSRERFDAVPWSTSSGELVSAGSRLISVETLVDAKATVASWAAISGVDFTSVAGPSLLR